MPQTAMDTKGRHKPIPGGLRREENEMAKNGRLRAAEAAEPWEEGLQRRAGAARETGREPRPLVSGSRTSGGLGRIS